MDLKAYYRKVREIEAQLPGPLVVVVSIETSDGGKGGVLTEVDKFLAAKHIAEGRACAASVEESDAFHLRNQEAKEAAEQAASINKMQFEVVPAKTYPKGRKE